MHISKIMNDKGSVEIYFMDLNYWEEFDLIIDILVKEFGCIIIKKYVGVYSKLYYVRSEKTTFEVRHDDMLGNYIYTENKEDMEYLIELSQNVIKNVMLMLKNIT